MADCGLLEAVGTANAGFGVAKENVSELALQTVGSGLLKDICVNYCYKNGSWLAYKNNNKSTNKKVSKLALQTANRSGLLTERCLNYRCKRWILTC